MATTLTQTEVNGSIRYAALIQSALMPDIEDLTRCFPHSFIFFIPGDVVSGDFYWFHRKKNRIAVVAADCTGHGVPVLPANGVDNIPLLINLMIGWNLHYAVLLPDNRDGQIIYKELKEKLFKGQSIDFHNKVMITENLSGIEEVFSTIDFKKHILQQRVGITESNLEYIENNNLSREDLAAAFTLRCQEENLNPSDFDEETRNNVKILISKILSMIGN